MVGRSVVAWSHLNSPRHPALTAKRGSALRPTLNRGYFRQESLLPRPPSRASFSARRETAMFSRLTQKGDRAPRYPRHLVNTKSILITAAWELATSRFSATRDLTRVLFAHATILELQIGCSNNIVELVKSLRSHATVTDRKETQNF